MKIKITDYGQINEPQIYKKISNMMLEQYNLGLNKKNSSLLGIDNNMDTEEDNNLPNVVNSTKDIDLPKQKVEKPKSYKAKPVISISDTNIKDFLSESKKLDNHLDSFITFFNMANKNKYLKLVGGVINIQDIPYYKNLEAQRTYHGENDMLYFGESEIDTDIDRKVEYLQRKINSFNINTEKIKVLIESDQTFLLDKNNFKLFKFLLTGGNIFNGCNNYNSFIIRLNHFKTQVENEINEMIDINTLIDKLNLIRDTLNDIRKSLEVFDSADTFISTFKNYTSDKTINNDTQGVKHSALYHVFINYTTKELIEALNSNGYYVRLPRISNQSKYGEINLKEEELKTTLFKIFIGEEINNQDYDNKSGLNIQIKFLNDLMVKLIEMAKSLYKNKFSGSSNEINNELLNLYKDMSGKVRVIYDLLPDFEQFKKMNKYFTELKMLIESGIKLFVPPTGGSIITPKINSSYVYTPKKKIKTNFLYLL